MDQLVAHAYTATGIRSRDRTPKQRLDRVQACLKRITPVYRRLTGKRPKSVPFAVTVIAEHKDGRQKAGLAHSYLIEVPTKKVMALVNRR